MRKVAVSLSLHTDRMCHYCLFSWAEASVNIQLPMLRVTSSFVCFHCSLSHFCFCWCINFSTSANISTRSLFIHKIVHKNKYVGNHKEKPIFISFLFILFHYSVNDACVWLTKCSHFLWSLFFFSLQPTDQSKLGPLRLFSSNNIWSTIFRGKHTVTGN